MNFRKTSEVGGGGGVISDPKNFVAVFFGKRGGGSTQIQKNLLQIFGKGGGVHSNPKNFVADFSTSRKKAQHSFPKIGWWGGVQGAIWKFSENSSNLVQVIFPKGGMDGVGGIGSDKSGIESY